MNPVRAALGSLIDYAGLFPPAALDLPAVVDNHLRYLQSPERWLLGRLIVPRARLDDLVRLLRGPQHGASEHQPAPWTISVLARLDDGALDSLGDDIASANEQLRPERAAVVAVEIAVRTAGDIERTATVIPDRYERYVELPLDADLPGLVRAAARAGCYAKARAGGVTAEAFPSPGALARFMALCAAHEVPFKATAGLHHPFKGSYPLTYEPQSLCAVMHGFVPIVFASALLYRRRTDEAGAAAILSSSEPFVLRDEAIRWGSFEVSGMDLSFARAHLFRSVGSCSFEEAVGDLRRERWIESS
ncbi:MAG TPA: hypothetical protein VNK41_00015 [Vicinamibacterales bacterium]|nr:hypothetical protein [Vicinamibacterales bacterium]